MADIKTGIGDPGITAYELTVRDQRALLQAEADRSKKASAVMKAIQTGDDIEDMPEPDPVFNLTGDISLPEMMVICRCSEDQIMDLTETQMTKVAAACRDANPLFFTKRGLAKEQATAQAMELIKTNPSLLDRFMTSSSNSKEQPQH